MCLPKDKIVEPQSTCGDVATYAGKQATGHRKNPPSFHRLTKLTTDIKILPNHRTINSEICVLHFLLRRQFISLEEL